MASGAGVGGSTQAAAACAGGTLRARLVKLHLPLMLVCFVALGAAWPAPGAAVGRYPVDIACTWGIFLISGLQVGGPARAPRGGAPCHQGG